MKLISSNVGANPLFGVLHIIGSFLGIIAKLVIITELSLYLHQNLTKVGSRILFFARFSLPLHSQKELKVIV